MYCREAAILCGVAQICPIIYSMYSYQFTITTPCFEGGKLIWEKQQPGYRQYSIVRHHVSVTWKYGAQPLRCCQRGCRKVVLSSKDVLLGLHESSSETDREKKESGFLLTQHSLAEVWKLSCQQANLSLPSARNILTPINLFHPMMHLCQTGLRNSLLSSLWPIQKILDIPSLHGDH